MITLLAALVAFVTPCFGQQAEMFMFVAPKPKLKDKNFQLPAWRGSYRWTQYTKDEARGHDATLYGAFLRSEEQEWSGIALFREHHAPAGVPRQILHDVSFGPSFRYDFEDGSGWGANALAGSASDRVFDSFEEVTLGANLYYRGKSRGDGSWIFILNYSNNRAFLNHIPIIGVAYWWEPSEELRVLAGLPFLSVSYKPHSKVTFNLAYFAPWVVGAEAAYRFFGPFQFFTRFNWGGSRWLLADRSNRKERLFYDEKRIQVGMKLPLARFFSLEGTFGYAFDRVYFTGEKFRQRNNVVEPGASPMYSIQASLAI